MIGQKWAKVRRQYKEFTNGLLRDIPLETGQEPDILTLLKYFTHHKGELPEAKSNISEKAHESLKSLKEIYDNPDIWVGDDFIEDDPKIYVNKESKLKCYRALFQEFLLDEIKGFRQFLKSKSVKELSEYTKSQTQEKIKNTQNQEIMQSAKPPSAENSTLTEYEWFRRIKEQWAREGLSISERDWLVAQGFSEEIHDLLTEEKLTFKQALELTPNQRQVYTHKLIYELIMNDELEAQDVEQLVLTEEVALKIKVLKTLIKNKIIDFQEALDLELSTAQLEILANPTIKHLVAQRRMTINEALNIGVITPKQQQTLSIKAIGLLIIKGHITFEEALNLDLTQNQIQLMNTMCIRHLILQHNDFGLKTISSLKVGEIHLQLLSMYPILDLMVLNRVSLQDIMSLTLNPKQNYDAHLEVVKSYVIHNLLLAQKLSLADIFSANLQSETSLHVLKNKTLLHLLEMKVISTKQLPLSLNVKQQENLRNENVIELLSSSKIKLSGVLSLKQSVQNLNLKTKKDILEFFKHDGFKPYFKHKIFTEGGSIAHRVNTCPRSLKVKL